ncbi:phage tail protein [Microbacterium sp. dk485]|uniref:phage tail protein n=1 Tax=Microbacterium TaxID=33882 RepID=UPI0010741192|nr:MULTISPECIES: phage tail protein [Microbacterium]TFV81750.1 phage tail protein [Microbacterium sp. dk485]TXK10864.1 phage tail protein [Microbacterium wangchenii]
MALDVETAVSVRYVVELDDTELGAFTGCEGLGVEVVLESREEGGNNSFVWQFPTRLKYPNVKLSRPLGPESEKVLQWLLSVTTGFTRSAGTIRAMTASGDAIAAWSLVDVVPVRWTGPSFAPDQPKVVTETLEIAHHGFTDTNSKY